MSQYVVTEAAADDLQQIDDYLVSADGVAAAERVSRAFEAAFERLAGQPLIGHRRSDLIERPYRFWSVVGFLIVYDADVRPIRIIRILRAKRDVAALLGA